MTKKEHWARYFTVWPGYWCYGCDTYMATENPFTGTVAGFKGDDPIATYCEPCYRSRWGWPELAHPPIEDKFGDLA